MLEMVHTHELASAMVCFFTDRAARMRAWVDDPITRTNLHRADVTLHVDQLRVLQKAFQIGPFSCSFAARARDHEDVAALAPFVL